MKWIKPIFFGALITFLFIGNVGMTIFKHYCEEDGMYTSYFIKTIEHCDDLAPEIALPDCCKKSKVDEEKSVYKDDCCSDEINSFKINLDYFNDKTDHQFPDFAQFEEAPPYDCLLQPLHRYSNTTIKYKNPPPKFHGKTLLIKNQVLII